MSRELQRSLVEYQDFHEREGRREKEIQGIQNYIEKPRHSRDELEAALRTFCTTVKDDLKINFPQEVSSWRDVQAVVETVQQQWEQKREKNRFRPAVGHLHKFCNTIQNHSSVLSMLPSNNNYVSLFYGSITTVIQASANYTKITEALPEALVEINDAVGAVENEVWLSQADSIRCLAWRMYRQIFSFLLHVIKWYTQRLHQRLLNSFNEALPQFFAGQLDEIRKTSGYISRYASFRTAADVRLSRIYQESTNDRIKCLQTLWESDIRSGDISVRRYEDFKAQLDLQRRVQLENPTTQNEILAVVWKKVRRRDIGAAVSEMLEGRSLMINQSNNQELCSDGDSDSELSMHPSTVDERGSHEVQSTTTNPGLQTRDAIILNSTHLENFFDREKIQIFPNELAAFFAPIISDLETWATATSPQVLHLCEIDGHGEESMLSQVADGYATLARENGLPVASYFCRLAHEEPPCGRTRETVELVALVYSLIRQLIELLPPELTADSPSFEKSRFDHLEGTLGSWPQALMLLQDLLGAARQPIIIFIIDGLDWLDDANYCSTEAGLRNFVEALRRHVDSAQETVIKVLFTTTTASSALSEVLQDTETALAPSFRKRRGKSLPGMEPMPIAA